ncbi:MAG: tetratricopeptide repeat protein [Acidobacteriota bacterium]|jgi:tetratricopeptide (TPR) repeat protein
MGRCKVSLLLILVSSLVLTISQASAQSDRIVIAAGTDEDHALQAITTEQDAQKKLVMYEDFVQKYSSNPQAVAYGNWQLAQAYQATGDMPKALDYGDKALAGSPHNLDILVSQIGIAQQAKNNLKLMDYAATGGEVCNSIAKQTKPEGMSDEDFSRKIADEKAAEQNTCEFLETSGFNAITAEADPKNRMAEIEKFTAAYPESKFSDQVSNYALYTLGPGQLNDPTRLVSFGEKTLAANPNSLPALLLMASYYADSNSSAKAITYAQKAIEVAKPDAADADKSRKLSAGAAHNTIGWAYLKQEKTTAAIPELKTAAGLLKGQDEQQYARALYGLGFAYGKLNKLTEAREVLTEAVKIPGPLQAMSQDLLTKVNSARAKGK